MDTSKAALAAAAADLTLKMTEIADCEDSLDKLEIELKATQQAAKAVLIQHAVCA